MIAYKLTTKDGKTRLGERNETQWGEGIEHTSPGGRTGKCGAGWLHAYCSPPVATMMNEAHVQIDDPLCWECEADVAEDLIDKLLCTRIKTLHRVDLPKLSLEQRIEIAIRAAMVVYDRPSWLKWAQDWLSDADRSEKKAGTTWVAEARVADAAWADARAAADAAWAGAWATGAAAVSVSWAADPAARKTLDLDKIISDVLQGRIT